MKYLFILLLTFSLVITLSSCSEDSTESNDDGPEIGEYTTANVKTDGIQYYSFSSNSATDTEPESYDLAFTLITRTEEVGQNSCVYFGIGQDPVMTAGQGNTIAKVPAASLDEVTEIPQSNTFMSDDPTALPVIGDDWLDQTFAIKPDVYIFNTCQGNYGLLEMKDYAYNPEVHQISSLKWFFKYNDNGSMDFTNTPLDSFITDNAYEKDRYFCFADGNLDFAYGTWEVHVSGSEIWLGPNVTVHKMDNSEINDVTTIPSENYTGDTIPFYATAGWYDSDENHKVIPKDYVYVVKTQDNEFAAFEVSSYYDNMGNSGAFTIQWKYLSQ